MPRIIFHTTVSVYKEATKDSSGYHAKDDVPHLMVALDDFALMEMQTFEKQTGYKAVANKRWITIEED